LAWGLTYSIADPLVSLVGPVGRGLGRCDRSDGGRSGRAAWPHRNL